MDETWVIPQACELETSRAEKDAIESEISICGMACPWDVLSYEEPICHVLMAFWGFFGGLIAAWQ